MVFDLNFQNIPAGCFHQTKKGEEDGTAEQK